MDLSPTPDEFVEAKFLELIARDLAENPERAVFATGAFAQYLAELTSGIEVNYDAAIEGDYRL